MFLSFFIWISNVWLFQFHSLFSSHSVANKKYNILFLWKKGKNPMFNSNWHLWLFLLLLLISQTIYRVTNYVIEFFPKTELRLIDVENNSYHYILLPIIMLLFSLESFPLFEFILDKLLRRIIEYFIMFLTLMVNILNYSIDHVTF